MASGMAICAVCGLGTRIRGWTLPCFWKWVWCDTLEGGEWKCICKACRREIWRDCTKLEPHDHFKVTEFYDAVAKRLQATVPAPSRKDQNLQPTHVLYTSPFDVGPWVQSTKEWHQPANACIVQVPVQQQLQTTVPVRRRSMG